MNHLAETISAGSFSSPPDSSLADSSVSIVLDQQTDKTSSPRAEEDMPLQSERSHDSEGTEYTANPPREPVPTFWNPSAIPDYEVTPEDQGDDGGEHPSTVGGAETIVEHLHRNDNNDNEDEVYDDDEEEDDDEDDEEEEEDTKSAGLSTQPPSLRSNNLTSSTEKKSPGNNNKKSKSDKPKEVDFYRNPTILSRLILNQRYTNAIHRLRKHPEEASIWVCTKRQLPSDSSRPKIKRNHSGGHSKNGKGHRLSPRKLENTTLVFVQQKASDAAAATADTTATTPATTGEDYASQEAHNGQLGRSLHSTISALSEAANSVATPDVAPAKAVAELATGSAVPSVPGLNKPTTSSTPPRRVSTTQSEASSSPATASPPPSPRYYYSLRQLPIHVACSNLFRHTDARLREQLEKLITHLVVVNPDGCMEVDHEGRLPLHEAIWHNCTAATVSILLMAAPDTIHARDKYGKSPLELNLNRCAAITNSVGGGGVTGSNDPSHLSTISNATAAGVTANNMAMALQQLQEQRRIHDLLQKGVQFWEHAKQEAMLRMKHGGKLVQSSSVSKPNAAGHNSSLNASLHSLGVKSVDSISVLAASSLNSESSNTVWTADQSRDFGRAGSLTDTKKRKVDQASDNAGSDRATSSVPSSAATQRAVRAGASSSSRAGKDKDDATVEPLAWSQLEQRCLQLELLLTEMYETNFELGEVIGALTRKKIELEDELELLVATDFAREAVSMRDDNMNLRKEVVRLQLLLQEHGIQDKQKNYYQNPYFSATDSTQMEDIDPERRLEVIQYLDSKNRMLQQQVDEWTRSSHKFQRKSEQLEMVINSLNAMEDESVVTSKEEGSIASRSILETLKTDSVDATERYLAKKLTELDDRLAAAKQRSEEEQAVSREERLRLIRENEALVSELKTVATSSNNNSPPTREKTNMRALPEAANYVSDFANALDVSWGKLPTAIPSNYPSANKVNGDPHGDDQKDLVDEELDAIIRETEMRTGLKIAPELICALREASFRKNSNDSGPLGDASSLASRRLSFSSSGTEQPTLAEDELMSLIAAAEKESGLTIPSELVSALRHTSLSNASAHPDSASRGGELASSQESRSYAARQPQDQPASLPVAAHALTSESPMRRSVPKVADEKEAAMRQKWNQQVHPTAKESSATRAMRKQTETGEIPKGPQLSPATTPRGAAPAIAIVAAREKFETKGATPRFDGSISENSNGPGAKARAASTTVVQAEIAVRPLLSSDVPSSFSSYRRPFNDDDMDFLLREIERQFGEPIPPDVVQALRRASTHTMLSSLSEESGIESHESISHASHNKREFTSLATSTSPLSASEVDRMLAEAERLLGRPLSRGLIRAVQAASASLATPSTSTYNDESQESNARSRSEGRITSHLPLTNSSPKQPVVKDYVENNAENALNYYDQSSPDSERDMQNLIQEAEMLYGGPLSPEIIAALKSKQPITGSEDGDSAARNDVGEDDIESIIREAERLQGMPLSEDLVKALRAVSFNEGSFNATDTYFQEYMESMKATHDQSVSTDRAPHSIDDLRKSRNVSSSTGKSQKVNDGKLDILLSTQSSESQISSDVVSRPLQPPERQLSTFTLVSVSSCGSTDLQDISGFEGSTFQGQLDQVSEQDDETNQDDTDHNEFSDSDLALLIEKAYESQGRTVPSDLLNAISAASVHETDDPKDFDVAISEVERFYGKALPNEVANAVREASQLPHLGDVDELDIVLEEAERMYGGQLSSFVKRAWREPSSSSLSLEFVEEAKRIYGNPIPNELSEALMLGVSQSSLDLGIDQELDRIILDAEQMYGSELPSDFISALRQASVRFSSSRFSLRSLLDTMDMPSIAEDSPLHDEDDEIALRNDQYNERGQLSSDELHAVFAEAAKMLGTKEAKR